MCVCLRPLLACFLSAEAYLRPLRPFLQPSEYTPFTALFFASLTLRLSGEEALPAGAFNVLTGTGASAGAPLTAHAGVDKVTFTGSVATGSAIMAACARDIRKVTLVVCSLKWVECVCART